MYCHVMTRSGVVQFRVSPEERERMDALAAAAGMRLSDWVRARALVSESSVVIPAASEVVCSEDVMAAFQRAEPQRAPYRKPFVPRPKGS